MNTPNDSPLGDQPVEHALEALRAVPARDPQRTAHGRAAFLAQAQQARTQSSAILLAARIRRWRATLAILVAALTGSAGVVYAAQDSLPNSPLLYQVKLASEDVRLALTQSPEQRVVLLKDYALRRQDELRAVGSSAAGERARARLRQQEAALETLLRANATSGAGVSQPAATPRVLASASPLQRALPTVTAHPSATPAASIMPIVPTAAAIVPQVTPQPTNALEQPRTATSPAATVTQTPVPLASPIPPRTPLVFATAKVRVTQLAPTLIALPTRTVATRAVIVATIEARATQLAPTLAAVPTTVAATREALQATRTVVATAEVRATVRAIRVTLTALPVPDRRATFVAQQTLAPPPLPPNVETPLPPASPQPAETPLPPVAAPTLALPAVTPPRLPRRP
jgi:hypothetical protein